MKILTTNRRWSRLNVIVLAIGLIGIIAAVIGLLTDRIGFFHAYLIGFAFLTQISLGCLLMLLIYYATGGRWGQPVLPYLRLGARLVPLVGILFIPILFGLPTLYSWANPEVVSADPLLQHQSLFLNPVFFTLRAVIYFGIWTFLAWRLTRPVTPGRTTAMVGLVVYFPVATLASVDWFMSLEPHWYSTIYGFIVLSSQALTAFAFVITLFIFQVAQPLAPIEEQTRLDIGNILLVALLTWVYMMFMQFLVIWSGDLSIEIPWYLERVEGGWSIVVAALLLLNGVLPFLLLLSRKIKRQIRSLSLVALLILLAQFTYTYWLIMPAFGAALTWLDLILPAGITAVWLIVFLARMNALKQQVEPIS